MFELFPSFTQTTYFFCSWLWTLLLLFALPPCFINLNIHWKDWCWSSNTLAPDAKSRLTGKDPEAGKDWGGHRWYGWMASLTQGTWVWANSGKMVKEREAWRAVVHRVANSQTRLSDGPPLFHGGNSLSLWSSSEEIIATFSSSRTNSSTS